MPNWVKNQVKIEGDKGVVIEMLTAIQNSKEGFGSIDFNKIIPMPESLNIEAGSRTERGMEMYRAFMRSGMSEEIYLQTHSEIRPDEWSLGKTACENIINYGAPTWYEWCWVNWGTKWDADASGTDLLGESTLFFETAWSAPHPIMDKLSETYPDITFVHRWADEDWGRNCGERIYQGGALVDQYIPEAEDAVRFSAEIWGCDPAELGGEELDVQETAADDGWQLILRYRHR